MDLDFYSLTETCLQIPLDKLFKDGFSTGHGYLREPESIRSYGALTAIALQCNQNEMHGGQSIPALDYYLAPGITKTFITEICKVLEDRFDIEEDAKSKIKKELRSKLEKFKYHILSGKGKEMVEKVLSDNGYSKENIEIILNKALKRTENETYQSMEALVHNLNSMHSRAGAQVPFTSINTGTDTSEEGRMVTKNLLLAVEAGLGAGETAIFPITIFKVKEGINYNPEDPNYDLFKLAIRVSAKRLFPTYEFMDAPFNLQYYKPGVIESEISTMGCVDGVEIITYKINNILYVENFERAWKRISLKFPVKTQGLSEYCEVSNVEIYDSSTKGFVNCKKFIRNPDKGDWYRLTCQGGRTLLLTKNHPLHIEGKGRVLLEDICIGDKVAVSKDAYMQGNIYKDTDEAWTLGATLCDGKYKGGLVISFGVDKRDIVQKYQDSMEKQGYETEVIERHRGEKGDYLDVVIRGIQKPYCDDLKNLFDGYAKRDRYVPSEVFTWDENGRKAFLCGMIDADGSISQRDNRGSRVLIGSTNPVLALGQMMLAQSLGLIAKVYVSRYTSKHNGLRYRVEFATADWMLDYLVSEKKRVKINQGSQSIWNDFETISKIQFIGNRNAYSYDVETESDRFDVSGFASHNCRTRVIGNAYDPKREVVAGRGNLSFTSINLPRIGIEAKGDIDKFFELLDEKMLLVKRQLIKRFKYQGTKHVYNYPFLMGQGLWLDSEKLSPNDTIEEILCHGSLSIGSNKDPVFGDRYLQKV